MEQKGRILGDTANLETTKEDITATLRHHESLLKSTNIGAPGVARGAIASRFEIVKQAINAKEPFRVHFVRVQAALTRAEEAEEKKRSAVLQDELIAGGEDSSCNSRGARGMSNSREETFLSSVERVGVRAPQIASGLAACAGLSVPLKEVTWSLLEEITRNPVDLGIKTGEGAVASWSFVAVLMCCREAVCVIGCASGRVVLIPLRAFGRHQTDKMSCRRCVVRCSGLLNKIGSMIRCDWRFDLTANT